MIVMKTNKGEIKIKLDFENTPKTAENFLSYVKSGHYDGTIFHRVIDGFMIQGGGFLPGLEEKEGEKTPIDNEAKHGRRNKRGMIAMARTSEPHSATCQFFINVVDNDFLDFKSEDMHGYGYCVFGEVVEGMDVVDAIKGVSTTNRMGHGDVPEDDIVIESVTVLEEVPAESP